MIKKQACLFLFLLSMILFPQLAAAKVQEYSLEPNDINPFIETNVRDRFSYSGLAAFYNDVSIYVVDTKSIKQLNAEPYTLKSDQVLALVGHYKMLILQDVVGIVSFEENRLLWHKNDTENPVSRMGKTRAQLLLKSDLDQLPQYFQKIKYAHLWAPFRLLWLGQLQSFYCLYYLSFSFHQQIYY